MLLRLAIALAVFVAVWIAVRLWRRPPRLRRLDLADLGVEGPAIVQFSTRSCAPCRTAAPVLREAAKAAGVAYAQVSLDERADLAHRYRIRTVPTIVVAGRGGAVEGVWTALPRNGEIVRAAIAATR
ncbi:MAG TPA: thioredoxin family protein [Actinomycetota bacterium]